MIFKVFILFSISFVLCRGLSEDDPCIDDDGLKGTCHKLVHCESAIEAIQQKRKHPKTCSYDPSDIKTPIICCVTNTTEELDDYDGDGCDPLSTSMSPPKTGQKAFDMCIEYQLKYVYPCKPGDSLQGTLSRHFNCHHDTDSLIIGGTDAAQYEFPHMALMGFGEGQSITWECGGSIISERFILTAGHCIATKDRDPLTYVAIGISRRSETADQSKVYKVKNIIKHPEYKSPIKYNDIALIETDREMQLDQYTVPACLHTGDVVNDIQVLATGWGNTDSAEKYQSEVLQKAILFKFSDRACRVTYRTYRNMKTGFDNLTQYCYGDRDPPKLDQASQSYYQKDTCRGDSGGPIQIKDQKIHCMYTIVGVTSLGDHNCGYDRPAIYTRVARYLSWIESIVWP